MTTRSILLTSYWDGSFDTKIESTYICDHVPCCKFCFFSDGPQRQFEEEIYENYRNQMVSSDEIVEVAQSKFGQEEGIHAFVHLLSSPYYQVAYSDGWKTFEIALTLQGVGWSRFERESIIYADCRTPSKNCDVKECYIDISMAKCSSWSPHWIDSVDEEIRSDCNTAGSDDE